VLRRFAPSLLVVLAFVAACQSIPAIADPVDIISQGLQATANLSVLNKDFMIGNAVNFGGGSTVTLVLPPPVKPAAVPPEATPVAPAAPTAVPSWKPILSDTSVPAGQSLLGLGIAATAAVAGFSLLIRRRIRLP